MEKTAQQLQEEVWELRGRMEKSYSFEDVVCHVIWTAMVVGGTLGAFLTG